jgi:hypothetical protein
MTRALLFLSLTACTPNAWQEAHRLCTADTPACDERLRMDFGLEPMSAEHEGPLLQALRRLATWDLGPWPPRSAEEVRPPFVELLEEAPGDEVAARLYNLAAATVEGCSAAPRMERYHLYWSDPDARLLVGPRAASVEPSVYAALVGHEIAHPVYGAHQRCDGGLECDPGWAGAWGTEAAILRLALSHCLDCPQGPLWDNLEYSRERIEAP